MAIEEDDMLIYVCCGTYFPLCVQIHGIEVVNLS